MLPSGGERPLVADAGPGIVRANCAAWAEVRTSWEKSVECRRAAEGMCDW